MVLGNFILPHWKSLWIPFFQVSNFILQSTEKFRSQNGGEWRVASGMPLAYANPHSDGMYNYFHYTIDEGETIQMTLCYYVKIDDIPLDELYLEITTQSSDHRFGIELDKLKT